MAVAAVLAVAGCRERERLVFTSSIGNGAGPEVKITAPHTDTTIHVHDSLTILGFADDPDGIDSVWFTVEGVPFGFGPIFGNGDDTTLFNLKFTPSAFPDTGTVKVFVSAVDQLGDTGGTRLRVVKVVP